MKRLMRNTLALLLCLSLCASYVPLAAADGIASGTWGSLSWTLDNNGLLAISGSGPMQGGKYPWKEYKDQIINIVISDGITNIANMAFGGHDPGGINEACSFLESITIPASVTNIGFGAFWDCSNLISVNIPSGVTNIGAAAFSECSSLTTVFIPASVTKIEERVFEGCSSLTRINVDEANQTYCDQDGVLFNKSGSKIVSFPGGRGGDYNIPSNVEAIEDYTFSGCVRLTGVTIPSGVTEISVAAFEGCNNLAKVRIPDSVTKIDNFAFLGCSALSSITIPLNVKTIGNQAFGGAGLTDITIPSRVTNIGIGAFYYCSGLTSISIPLSMRSIGSSAFDGCSALTDVYFEGKDEEWGTISIEAGNDMLTSANIHYETGNSNEDPVIDIGSGISVFESLGDPEIASFRFYQDVNGTDYIDLTDSTENLIVNYEGSTDPYKFEIEVNNPELVSHVYITANAFDGVRQMEAVYDSNSGNYIAEGYFDEEDKFYQPESIKLEYSVKATAPEVGNSLNWDEMMPYLSSLTNADVSVIDTGSTNTGTIDFSGTVDELNKVALNYSIKTIDSSFGTQFGALRNYYQTGENILSYVVPGLNNSKYYAYLDFSDPLTYKMLLDDGLNVGGKIIELEMTFLDTESNQYLHYEDMSTLLGHVGTISKVVGQTYNICKDNEELRQEIANSTTIEDKNEAIQKADELKYDQIAFMLLTTALPIIVASGPMGAAPAMLFTAIIGVVSATSNMMYDFRVAGILKKEVPTDWYGGVGSKYGRISDSDIFWKMTPDGHLRIFGEGDLPDSRYVHYLMTGIEFGSYWMWPYTIDRVTIHDGITSIGNGFFHDETLTSLELPSSVKRIGVGAFYNCSNLKYIKFSEGLQVVDEYAFCSTEVETVVFPNSLTFIGNRAFFNCAKLMSVVIRNNVTTIGDRAFNSCNNIKTIDVSPENEIYSSIDGVLFSKDFRDLLRFPEGFIGDYVIPDGVESIGSYAFDSCKGLTSVTIPNSVSSINGGAFWGCENLSELTIPYGVISIGASAFRECINLRNVTIPNSVVSIGLYAFSSCYSLTSITIPASVVSIYNYAFEIYNGNLTEVRFLGAPPTIDENSFDWVKANAYYPDGRGWTTANMKNYGGTLTWIPFAALPDFILPAELTTIEEEAFAGGAFTYVKLSESTVSVGRRAFADCPNLIYIYIPEVTTSIDPKAFDNVTELTIVGKAGSTAETYAQNQNYHFVAIP